MRDFCCVWGMEMSCGRSLVSWTYALQISPQKCFIKISNWKFYWKSYIDQTDHNWCTTRFSVNDRKPHNGHIKQPQINYMKSSIFYPSILFPKNWKFKKIKEKKSWNWANVPRNRNLFFSNYYQKNNQIQFRKTLVILWLFFPENW
jgi:hypothetical protein